MEHRTKPSVIQPNIAKNKTSWKLTSADNYNPRQTHTHIARLHFRLNIFSHPAFLLFLFIISHYKFWPKPVSNRRLVLPFFWFLLLLSFRCTFPLLLDLSIFFFLSPASLSFLDLFVGIFFSSFHIHYLPNLPGKMAAAGKFGVLNATIFFFFFYSAGFSLVQGSYSPILLHPPVLSHSIAQTATFLCSYCASFFPYFFSTTIYSEVSGQG